MIWCIFSVLFEITPAPVWERRSITLQVYFRFSHISQAALIYIICGQSVLCVSARPQVHRVGRGQSRKVRGRGEEGHALSGLSTPRSVSSDSTTRLAIWDSSALIELLSCLVGSAKAHERGGCAFCESERFCSPQDYDSQCPCEWHRTERTRQASSVEAGIKKYVNVNICC